MNYGAEAGDSRFKIPEVRARRGNGFRPPAGPALPGRAKSKVDGAEGLVYSLRRLSLQENPGENPSTRCHDAENS